MYLASLFHDLNHVQVFGEEGDRLMCHPHFHRNIEPKIQHLQKESKNKTLGTEVMNDIQVFQYVVTQKSFECDFQALEDKYLKNVSYNNLERTALVEFFQYFRKQWGPGSPVCLWFEHAHPWHVSHNQVIIYT